MLKNPTLFSFVAFKYFQMESICPTAALTPERHFSPDCCFGWPSSPGNTGHGNSVKLFNSFSLLVDKEFIYTENIQKCASGLIWGIKQHPQEAQLHRLWFLSLRRCDCRTKCEQSLELWVAWRSHPEVTCSLALVLQTEEGGSLHSVSFICRNLCCRMLCMLKAYINRKKNKPDKAVEGCKKASGYWITNLTSVMGDLCKLSGPETILERHCCELCAVLTVLPTPLLLDRVSFLWLPIGIWCYVPVPLLTHDFHPDYLFLKLTDLALQLNSALNIFFTLKSVRTILSENTFWLPVEHSEKDEPLDRLASHINSKYYWFWELNFPWEVWISSSIMVWLSNRWFISY